jgi:hypothetical protein
MRAPAHQFCLRSLPAPFPGGPAAAKRPCPTLPFQQASAGPPIPPTGRRPSRSPSPGQRPGESVTPRFLQRPNGPTVPRGEWLARWAGNSQTLTPYPGRCPGLGERPPRWGSSARPRCGTKPGYVTIARKAKFAQPGPTLLIHRLRDSGGFASAFPYGGGVAIAVECAS